MAALSKLDALTASEAPGADLGGLAAAIGLSRVAFYRLRKRWTDDRTLRAIIPHGRRKSRAIAPRGGSAEGALFTAARIARRLVEEGSLPSSISNAAQALVDELDGEISPQAAMRLLRSERLRIQRDPSHLRRLFGRQMVIDISAVSLAVPDGEAVVVAVVAEVASGLILGHDAGLVSESIHLQGAAIARAISWLGDQADGSDLPANTALVLGWTGDTGLMRDLSFAAWSTPGIKSVAERGPQRYGRQIVGLLGHRLGRLQFRPRATEPGRSGHFDTKSLSLPPTPLENARALVDEAVEAHNRPIIELLIEQGIMPPTDHLVNGLAQTLRQLEPHFTHR